MLRTRLRPTPLFKGDRPPLSARVERAFRRMDRTREEERNKAKARRRDRGCRWPLCGCRRLRLSCEVSHVEHKGAGGNPSGDRSDPRLLMHLCRERHRSNSFSIDQGTIAWEPLDKRLGADGPVRFLLDVRLLGYFRGDTSRRPSTTKLVEIARESSPGILEALDPEARVLLEHLATMEL